jgi:hypothetical protein
MTAPGRVPGRYERKDNWREWKMKITRELLRRWGACYEDAKIASLLPEGGLTPLEVASLAIPAEDRLRVLLREDIIPARELRLLACGWAESACRKSGWADARSLEAIAVARRFAVGEASEAELAAARSAARSAARWAWSTSKSAWSARGAAAEAAAAAAGVRAMEALSASKTAEWAVQSEVWSAAAAEEAAWSEQLADVVRVLKRIDEAAKAGKVAK